MHPGPTPVTNNSSELFCNDEGTHRTHPLDWARSLVYHSAKQLNFKESGMKSTLKLILSLLAATLMVVAVSCNSGTEGPSPGTGTDQGTDGGASLCQASQTLCNNMCVNTASDVYNCGGCGNACGPAQNCAVAVCRCVDGLQDCGGGCVSLQSNPQNCGACGTACGAGQVCNRAACAAACDTGLTNCSGACVNPLNDPFNCGTCGTACGAGQSCLAGTCTCPNGQPVCNGQCTDVMSNNANCGSCGTACATGQQCVNGACQGGASNVTGSTTTTNTTTAGATTGATTGTTGTSTGTTSTTGTGGATSTSTTGTGTTGSTGDTPPGWWTYDPLSWHGCSWTGIDSLAGSTTTITPQDFLTLPAGDSYCVAGTVHPDYEAVSLLGFNLNEDPADASCAYNPATASEMGPPGVTLGGSGIAINFTKSIASVLRVQIQGPAGATDENDRWCAAITDVQGPVFVPYSEFNTHCWDGSGNAYNNEPVSAVVFLVPGAENATQYDYCIHGFATGDSADDAPEGGGGGGSLEGDIGGAGSEDLDYQRVKVKVDGKSYIIQNNNWGNPGGTNQTIHYKDNSFTITQETGGEPGGGAPASFPSIFIGANGDTQNGQFDTRADDNLPKVVSTISSIPTKFAVNRTSGEYNATYDVWFAASAPAPGSYDDGISGFVMVWLYDPPSHQPIGSVQRTASIAGHTFDVWVGPRGGGSSAPVVSYVSQTTLQSMDFDLLDFIKDAEQSGISSSWYLTDVFGGFEIWNGSGTNGLAVTEFSVAVN